MVCLCLQMGMAACQPAPTPISRSIKLPMHPRPLGGKFDEMAVGSLAGSCLPLVGKLGPPQQASMFLRQAGAEEGLRLRG
jgi:hypothetical protein